MIIPTKPPTGSFNQAFSWRAWFQKVWLWVVASSKVMGSQTASFQVTDGFFYPVNATGGAITVTLPLTTQIGSGRGYLIKKTDSSANAVTVTPSGSDTIDGGATFTLDEQNEAVHVISDGSGNWWVANEIQNVSIPASGGWLKSEDFTSDGTFTWPASVDLVWVTLIGGGGGGGAGTLATTEGGGGGGSGEWVYRFPVPRNAATTSAVVIGAAGTGASTTGANGTDGGDSTFTTTGYVTVTARGGKGGKGSSNTGGNGGGRNAGSGGGVAANGAEGTQETLYAWGGSGGGGGATAATATGGTGGPAGQTSGTAATAPDTTGRGGGSGASSVYGAGGAGGGGSTPSDGAAPGSTAYGAGGGGGAYANTGGTISNGGNGAKGYCIVEWIGT